MDTVEASAAEPARKNNKENDNTADSALHELVCCSSNHHLHVWSASKCSADDGLHVDVLSGCGRADRSVNAHQHHSVQQMALDEHSTNDKAHEVPRAACGLASHRSAVLHRFPRRRSE